MRGGFYNLKNLASCGWGDEAKGSNYCKDKDNDVILNIQFDVINQVF